MDPQQRILLHVAHEALNHAGYVPDATKNFERNTFGCYIGVATNDYVVNLRDEIDLYYSTGMHHLSHVHSDPAFISHIQALSGRFRAVGFPT
jgi:acyl transferase domain-containing protein